MRDRLSIGHQDQHYLVRVVSPDGCVKEFDVPEKSPELALQRFEAFLRRHWKGYSIVEIESAEDMPKRRSD